MNCMIKKQYYQKTAKALVAEGMCHPSIGAGTDLPAPTKTHQLVSDRCWSGALYVCLSGLLKAKRDIGVTVSELQCKE